MKPRALLAIPVALALLSVAATEPPGNQYPFTRGTIKKIDYAGKRLVLITPSGPRQFEFTERTYLFRGQEKLTPEKLKVGDYLKINYYTNETGQAFIRRLKVTEPDVPAETPTGVEAKQ